MFKVPPHQVAGHKAVTGQLGPLMDDSGLFYKPLQDDKRGSNEVTFYKSFTSNTDIPSRIRTFFPIFHGTKVLEASDGSGPLPHLVLQDLVLGRVNPSIMDVKIGSRTWPLESSEDYIAKCLKKDRETTSLSLGFRISGFQIFGNKETGFWKPDKKFIMSFSTEDVRLNLRKFVSSNSVSDSKPDCAFASKIYGGSNGILAQLLELKAWFENQTIYHFHSCSILLIFEKESALEGKSSGAKIKLVDFSHVIDGKGVIDHNFLGGLCSLIKFISEIVTIANESLEKAHLQQKNQLLCDNGVAK